MLIKLAWRNIFRNKRRSAITISSIVFALIFAVFMRSLQFGAYGNMLDNIVGTYLGYVQIHGKGFWEEKTLENSFDQEKVFSISEDIEATYISNRIEGFALVSSEDNSKPVAVLGLDAEKEKKNIRLDEKVIAGSYLSQNKSGILVGKSLKDILKVEVGDSLIFVGQGYQGSIASGIFPICGVVDLKTPELNKRTVIFNLTDAQDLFSMYDRVTTSVIGIDHSNWQNTQRKIEQIIDTSELEVMNWQEMLPELKQLITVDKAGGSFVLLILYSIISFSLFGTVLMLTEERSFEYGVLVAIGMAKKKIIYVAILETLMMAVAGIFIGLLVSFPIALYFNINPINLSGQMQEVVESFGFEALIPASLDPSIPFIQGSTIFLIVCVVNIYTIHKIKHLHPIEAMKK